MNSGQGQVVSIKDFEAVLPRLTALDYKSCDTETTGLRPFQGDRLFSVIIGAEDTAWYFNFQTYTDDAHLGPDYVLPRSYLKRLGIVLDHGVVFMHNAKFDLHMLGQEGIKPDGLVYCTQTMARVLYNDHMKYDLATCAERIGEKKDDAVEKYISENKLWKWRTVPGKKKRFKDKYYDEVPFNIIAPYGIQDAIVTYKLGVSQLEAFKELDTSRPKNQSPVYGLVETEIAVTKVCTEVETTGLLLDVEYCNRAVEYLSKQEDNLRRKFELDTGFELIDSGKHLGKVFTAKGYSYEETEKGNPTFKDEVLEKYDNPVAELIREHRGVDKLLNTYFRNYLFYADTNRRIHADMRQGGTATGRFSCKDPNLQNIPKGEGGEFPVRRAFACPEDHVLVAIDYNQMEFRLMLDYAGEHELIGRIKDGFDPHTATSELVGIERRPAKILNFGLLYGMGVGKLALTLGVDEHTARNFKQQYFRGLPAVKRFLKNATKMAETRGFVYDWSGRIFHYPDPRFAYKAANSIIQGGCADVVKKSMVEVQSYLAGKRSKLLMQIHDELWFQIHKDELSIVAPIQDIMENVYPQKYLPLTCSVEHSYKNFGQLEEGAPRAQ
jgi:DNA polymerase-1